VAVPGWFFEICLQEEATCLINFLSSPSLTWLFFTKFCILATRKKGLPVLERIFPVGKNGTMAQFLFLFYF
jgi:hypothetical protein